MFRLTDRDKKQNLKYFQYFRCDVSELDTQDALQVTFFKGMIT